jgi:hypothetical protein
MTIRNLSIITKKLQGDVATDAPPEAMTALVARLQGVSGAATSEPPDPLPSITEPLLKQAWTR